MKKIYSLLMALCMVFSAMANSPYIVENQWAISTSEVAETLHSADVATHKVAKQAKFNQQDREAIAAKRMAKATPALQVNGARQIEAVQTIAKQAMPANAVRKAPAKAAAEATDTVEIVGNEWTYEYYSDTKDWYMAVIDASQTYVVRLDYLVAEEDFAGTYNIDNLDLNYSYLTIYDEDRNKTYVNYVEADFTVSVTEEGKFLTANLLCENGIRYLVTAEELPLPEPIGNAELAYTNATLEDGTRSSETFQFWADENGVYTSFLIASDEVVGEYTQDDMYVAYANYIMFVDGIDTTFVDFLGFDMAITKEGQTYNLVADALGSDTIMYHITMSYTKPAPTDTIDIVATNMTIDEFEFWGMYYCTITASNEEYEVTLDMANGLPLGELTSADFNVEWSSVYRIADATEIVFDDILSATVTEVDGQRAIKAQALGVDNIIYNLDLSYVLPTATDTVEIAFTTPASAEYYDSEGDYYIYNENEEYIVTLDIYAEKNALEGEYEGEDFYLYYTQVGLIEDGDTTGVAVAAAKATVTKVSEELVHIDAELLGENGVLYLVSTDVTMSKAGLQYDATEGAVDRTYTAEEVVINKATGYFQIQATAADKSDKVAMVLFGAEDEETIIPVGTYEINGTQEAGTVLASTGVNGNSVTYSFYGKTNAQGQIMVPCYFFVGGTVEVSAADGVLTIEVNAVNSYDVPVHIVMEYDLNTKQGLQYDMTEGEVNRTYSDADVVEINTDYVSSNQIYLDITAADGSDMISVAFIMNTVDPTITIPAGTYPINDSFAVGSVYASVGVVDGSIYPSFYGQMNAAGQIKIPCYFMVGGNVVVENVNGHLKVTIDALNSYDVPAHIVYEATATSVENVVVEKNANKVIENGQFFIMKEGVKYNVLGGVVK